MPPAICRASTACAKKGSVQFKSGGMVQGAMILYSSGTQQHRPYYPVSWLAEYAYSFHLHIPGRYMHALLFMTGKLSVKGQIQTLDSGWFGTLMLVLVLVPVSLRLMTFCEPYI